MHNDSDRWSLTLLAWSEAICLGISLLDEHKYSTFLPGLPLLWFQLWSFQRMVRGYWKNVVEVRKHQASLDEKGAVVVVVADVDMLQL